MAQLQRDVPEVDPDTRGQENHISMSTDKSMDNHPVGWQLLYETPLGMFCLYGKVMLHTATIYEYGVAAGSDAWGEIEGTR